jgi:hypothetical protein
MGQLPEPEKFREFYSVTTVVIIDRKKLKKAEVKNQI